MLFKAFLLLVCSIFQIIYLSDALTCRVCKGKERLEDCDENMICAADEDCYMDEVVSSTGITYEGGCRASDVCATSSSAVHLGRRDDDRLVACSRCCNVGPDPVTRLECNAQLCGLRSTASNVSQCYHCENVKNPDSCNKLITCQHDEVCGTQTYLDGASQTHTYTMGCYPAYCIRTTAYLLTLASHLNQVKPALSPTHPALPPPTHPPTHPSMVGKRSITGCSVCCGDPYCNTGDCVKLEEKLLALEMHGHLQHDTLKYIP